MEEELSINNILGAEDAESLFTDIEETQEEKPEENKEENKETTEVNVDELFTEKPEGVGSEDHTEEKEDTNPDKVGTSPEYIYSSIAKAFAEEGIFPDLDNDTLSKIKTPEDFREIMENQMRMGLEEKQRRIDEALTAGIEPTEIKKYENALGYLDSINDETISKEGEEGETLRKLLIFQDFINRGYSKERALKEVNKSLNAGTDIDDAKDALEGNKEFFQSRYNDLIDEAKEEAKQEESKRRELAEALKKSILEDKKVFGDIEIDKATRQKVFDSISKPVYKDPDTGEYMTAIQKYEKENRTDFLKHIGLIYTLTDGFKNLNGLIKTKVNKEMKRGLRELEHTLNNTARTSDGNIRFVSGVGDDPESFIGKGLSLDI